MKENQYAYVWFNTRTREGETRKEFRERLRQSARTAGLTRRDAVAYAGREIERVWPQDGSPGEDPNPPVAEASADPEPILEPDDPESASGLADLPSDWPQLPANASLASEVQWVTANRLRVRDGNGVDLSRALGPAPSHSALSWLETALLFPAKFADVAVKVTQNQEDEREHVRREKLSIQEIEDLLTEMLEDGDQVG